MLMAVFYLLIDVWKIQKWSKMFVIIGTNSIIAIQVGTFLISDMWQKFFTGGLKDCTGSWFATIHSTLAFLAAFLILRHLFRYKIFIKV